MTMNRRTLLQSASLALATAGFPAARAWAQGSDKPLNLLVPWPAGGPVDVTARILQPELSRLSGVPVVIENTPGAGGVIGLNRYAQRPQAERGLVMISVSDAITSLPAAQGQKLKPEEFRLLNIVASGGASLMVREGLPARTFDELVRLMRGQAAQSLKVGHLGVGSWQHLTWEELAARVGLTALQVPYKGVPDILRDLGAGDLDMALLPGNAAVMGYPRVRAIATSAAMRTSFYPDLPTLAESTAAAGYSAEGWWALGVMRDTAPAEVDRLERWSHAAIGSHAVASAFKAQTINPPPVMSRQDLDSFFKAEIERFRVQLKRLGLLAAA
ncbi:MAG: tripartite tricarboxylate transporter substrate binding protein [Burkholderiales bacterium]|nr:tripartite tricarboxylate transporter substrate binding protein [Burkholderiales bacterium]